MRPIEEIKRLIEMYPPRFRRWCDTPENGGCACMGCVRWPAPSTVRGDPEGKPFPNPEDALTKEEVEAWAATRPEAGASPLYTIRRGRYDPTTGELIYDDSSAATEEECPRRLDERDEPGG